MKKAFTILLCSVITLCSLSLSACEKKDTSSIDNSEKEKEIIFQKEKNNIISLNIYFPSNKNNDKSEVSMEQRNIKKDELLAEAIMNELIHGPSIKSELYPILDNKTRVLSVSIKDKIAYINLSSDANKKMTTEKEESCIKSIVLSLTQLSSVDKVKIYVNNVDTNLFGNNFDLTEPIGKENLKNLKSN
ncbi:GerMN domain-containing protein [Clostridium sp. cel8]|uniref:GerMN domain-containing protein n=1 Tax=unclassified Clostridium TaxID=2614128 RepID=UPI0015F735ED|nr:GerMN domain-containing protein [Clostridium sp. cel8]MBA5851716.1 GerMN domain-containing protein [Clostridium sp. cel8]